MRRVGVAAGLVAGLLSACSSTRTGEGPSSPVRPAHTEESIIHLHDEPSEEPAPDPHARAIVLFGGDGDGGRGVVVAADAGHESGEIVWLVAHIGDMPDRLRGDDSPNVRQLAGRGVVGVRAAAQVLFRGDGERTPFARRVMERVAFRICGARGLPAVQALAAWIELGGARSDAGMDATEIWARAADAPWDSASVARVLRWADAGLPCEPAALTVTDGSVAGANSGMDATVDAT